MRFTACSSRWRRWSSAATRCFSSCWRCMATILSAACYAVPRSRFEHVPSAALFDGQLGDVEAQRGFAGLRLLVLDGHLRSHLELGTVGDAFEIDPDRSPQP